jgi:DNA replicative helicase MCM subunit Mcm2 (Cdc46/Mcm family)
LKATEQDYLNLNMEYMWIYDAELYNQMLRYPAEIVPLFEQIVYTKFQEIVMSDQNKDGIFPGFSWVIRCRRGANSSN